MPPHRHSADLRGRRQDPGIRLRDMAAGLGIGFKRVLSMENGTASDVSIPKDELPTSFEDKTFYRTWLSRIEGWSAGVRHIELQRVREGGRFR
jgi:hypothetical protein